MFTSQAPQLFNALRSAVPGDSARQLTQIFANCNQALTHRGGVDLQNRPLYQKNGVVSSLGGDDLPPWATGNQAGNGQTYPFGGVGGSFYGGNYYGVDGPSNALQFAYQPGSSGWAPYVNVNLANYNGGGPLVFPPPGGPYRGGDWITYLGDTNIFDVAPRVTNNTSQYYGGPTFQVAGDTIYDNTVTQNSYVTNLSTTNLTVEEVNGVPVKGDKGDPGDAGPGGAVGNPGNPGNAGPAGANGAGGLNGAGGAGGGNRIINNNFVIGGGGGGGGLQLVPRPGPPGPAGPGAVLPDGFLRNFGDLKRDFRILEQAFRTLQNKLKSMLLEATLKDDCTIELKGNWPEALNGIKKRV